MQNSLSTSISLSSRPHFKPSSYFQIWCERTHSNGHKTLRIYENENGEKISPPRHETVPEYPMPFTFVDTSINNINIYIRPFSPFVSISSISLMVCDNRNHLISRCLKSKNDRTPKDVLEAEFENQMYTFKLVGVCKTSAQVYDSNVLGFMEHAGALLHLVLLIKTSIGVIEARLPEFWSVSNSPHRQREVNTFRMMMDTFRLSDGSMPEQSQQTPNRGRERRERGSIRFTRGKYVMELTRYLDYRSQITPTDRVYQQTRWRDSGLVAQQMQEASESNAFLEYLRISHAPSQGKNSSTPTHVVTAQLELPENTFSFDWQPILSTEIQFIPFMDDFTFDDTVSSSCLSENMSSFIDSIWA